MPGHWLMKSEPDEASIDHLAQAPGQVLPWTGVRNHQARNFMRDAMQVGEVSKASGSSDARRSHQPSDVPSPAQ